MVKVPTVGQIIYYKGVVTHYYKVLEINGTKGKIQFLGQSPDDSPTTIYDWDFKSEHYNPLTVKHKVYR